MKEHESEESPLRTVALQNAQAVFLTGERAERELHESTERITNILESISDGFVALDQEWRFTYVNPRAEQIFQPLNKTRASLLGKSYWAEFPDVAGTPTETYLRRAMAEKTKIEFEIFYAPLNSWFHFRLCPARDGISIYFLDITRNKLAAEAVLENAERLRAMFNQAAVGIAMASLDGRFVEANQKFSDILGYSMDELRKLTFLDITHTDDLESTRSNSQRLLAGEIPDFAYEKRYLRKDRNIVWSLTTVTLLKDAAGKPQRIVAVIDDISTRKAGETALRESEERFRVLADSIPQLTWMANPEGHIFWYNRRWYEYTGTTPEQMEGWGWKTVHDPNVLPQVMEKWNSSLRTGTPFEMEFPLRGADGVFRWFLTRVRPFCDADGKVTRWFGTNTNIDEQRRLLQSLSEARDHLEKRVEERTTEIKAANESLRDLSASLLKVQDDERRRLARELHDSVGQILAALSMNIGVVQMQAHKLSPDAARAVAQNAQLVQQASTEIRTLSHLLHPPLLEIAGLTSTLRWYVDGFSERSKIKVDMEIPSDFRRLPSDTELAIFRIVQECLTNIHRHSGSSAAAIRIEQDQDRLRIQVQDNGKGISLEKQTELIQSSRGGVGFRGMRERLRQLGGSLEIHSQGSGTVVTATLLLNQNQSGQNRSEPSRSDQDRTDKAGAESNQRAGLNGELDVPSEQPL
jgi:PAS domain S-box-containing protein